MRTFQSDIISTRLIRSTETSGIRSKYLAPSICTLHRSLSMEFVDLEEFSHYGYLVIRRLANALGETFPHSPFATRHLLDTSADKNETSGLGECLRFLAMRCTYARNFMQSHLVTPCKCLCKLFYSE